MYKCTNGHAFTVPAYIGPRTGEFAYDRECCPKCRSPDIWEDDNNKEVVQVNDQEISSRRLCEEIYTYLRENEVNLLQFGESCGIYHNTIYLYCGSKPKHFPGAKHLRAMCRKLNVSADFILNLSDTKEI